MIYLLTEPLNTLEAKGRVLGNYPAHWNGEGKKLLREICQPLKDKGVAFAYASDLDADALHIVADELHIPVSKEYGLRRFNCGKQHGAKLDHLQGILDNLIQKWKANPDVPIRNGDSWRSVEKRVFKAVDRILEKEQSAVIVTDARTASLMVFREPKALVMNGEALKPAKIYVIGKKVNHARTN
jgi:broad specificity phosphatase PhoE